MKPRTALDDTNAHFTFELPDARRKGRLRHLTRGCGVCEVTFSCQRNQVLEFPDNHWTKRLAHSYMQAIMGYLDRGAAGC